MLFKYETHCHTCESSPCAVTKAETIIEMYHKNGYSGIFISDHFINTNRFIRPEMSWEEKVARFTLGYDLAKAEGDRVGLDVFLAWEYGCGKSDFLIYGLDKDWLLANPDQLELPAQQYLKKVREDGGMVIQAHPFRYEEILCFPSETDGVEVFNAGIPQIANRRADWYAESYGLLRTAGTDFHCTLSHYAGGVLLPERIGSSRDFVRLIQENRHDLFCDHYTGNSIRI